jgi:hypothetical protein
MVLVDHAAEHSSSAYWSVGPFPAQPPKLPLPSRAVPGRLGDRPPVLTRHRRQQPQQIRADTSTWLHPPEPRRYPRHQLIQLSRPPATSSTATNRAVYIGLTIAKVRSAHRHT